MKKLLALIGCLLLVGQLAYADSVTITSTAAGPEQFRENPKILTVTWVASSNSTLYSPSIDLWGVSKGGAYFGAQYTIVSAMGSVSLTSVTAQASNDNSNWATPDGESAFIGAITDENWHYGSFSPPVSRYIRFMSVTAAGSATDSTITLKLNIW